jgi:hypothetical protein
LQPYTIRSVNNLPLAEKLEIYTRLIPRALLERYNLPGDLRPLLGRNLLLDCEPGSSTAEMQLFHQVGFPDPLLHGQITDTITGHTHVLFYTLNDPEAPRFDIDCLPDGRATLYGTRYRNLAAETGALQAGLAPGQIRRGLRLLSPAIQAFEDFVASLGQEMYFAEPLYYHNAVLFERFGFAYQKGRRLMERIQAGFSAEGDLQAALDGSTPFRSPEAARSIRLRSWAIHDLLLGEPFSDVTMYKFIGKAAGLNTCPEAAW